MFTRFDKIKELRDINLCAAPIVETMDMGVQYVIITSEGAGTGFGDMAQWPCHKNEFYEFIQYDSAGDEKVEIVQTLLELEKLFLETFDVAITSYDEMDDDSIDYYYELAHTFEKKLFVIE